MSPPETRLTVEVKPRAGRDEIVGWRGAHLRVRVTAPPAAGAANQAVRTLLSERLRCPRARVEIVRGQTARRKILRIVGLAPGEAAARLAMPATVSPTRTAGRST